MIKSYFFWFRMAWALWWRHTVFTVAVVVPIAAILQATRLEYQNHPAAYNVSLAILVFGVSTTVILPYSLLLVLKKGFVRDRLRFIRRAPGTNSTPSYFERLQVSIAALLLSLIVAAATYCLHMPPPSVALPFSAGRIAVVSLVLINPLLLATVMRFQYAGFRFEANIDRPA